MCKTMIGCLSSMQVFFSFYSGMEFFIFFLQKTKLFDSHQIYFLMTFTIKLFFSALIIFWFTLITCFTFMKTFSCKKLSHVK